MYIRTLVITKYYGPTNTRGARIKATVPSGRSQFIEWDHRLSVDENHLRAAANAYNALVVAPQSYLHGQAAWIRESYLMPKDAGVAHVVQRVLKHQAPNYEYQDNKQA